MDPRDIARVIHSSCLNQGEMKQPEFIKFVNLACQLGLAGVITDVSRLTEIKSRQEWREVHVSAALVFSEEDRWRLGKWINEAFREGADSVEVLLNMTLFREKRIDELVAEMIKIRRESWPHRTYCKGKVIKWVLDTRQVHVPDISEVLPRLRSCNLTHIKVGSDRIRNQALPGSVEAVRQALGDQVTVEASGGSYGLSYMGLVEELLHAGADQISTTNAHLLFNPLRSC